MNEREELMALRRLAELEAKAGSAPAPDAEGMAAVQQGMQNKRNQLGGVISGAGSIGATLMAPFDMAEDAMERYLTGKPTGQTRNEKRREGIDAGLTSLINSDPTSGQYQLTRGLTQVAGVSGVGPAAAGMLTNAAPRAAAAVPGFVEALRTGGATAGGSGLLTRSAGGFGAGVLSAGLTDPNNAIEGGLVGAAFPVATKVAGVVGNTAGKLVRGAPQPPEVVAAVRQAREAGYVIPPTQVNPSLRNRTMEGFAGKLTIAQNASAKNQAVTSRLAAKAVGLPEDVPITPEALDEVRKEAGKAYAAISKLGKFDATGVPLPKEVAVQSGISPLLAGKTKSVDAGELVRAWKQSNADATAYYRAYGRDANPETLAKAKAAASAAKQIDDFMAKKVAELEAKRPDRLIADFVSGKIDEATFVQQSLTAGSKQSMTKALKEARQRIAKTYSVESAMNPITGTIDARKLAKQLEKGKVLSGDLLTAAQFAGRFPKAAQTVEGMGSLPQTSPLDWGAAFMASVASGNPMAMASVATRPTMRAAALSGPVQNRLVPGPPNALMQALENSDLTRLGYLAAPSALSGR